MAIGTIATVVTIAAAAASLANIGYQAAQGAPQVPNMASASRDVAQAQANALPQQRAMAAAEQQGGEAVKWGYQQRTYGDQQRAQAQARVDSLQKQIDALGPKPAGAVDPSGWLREPLQKQLDAARTSLANIPAGGGTVYVRSSDGVVVPKDEAVQSFKGFGTADVQGQLAGKIADIQTQLQQKYGPAFATQARLNAEQSDPAGFAARQKELELIRGEMDNPMPINPLSTTLEQQIGDRLRAGAGLTDMEQQLLDDAVAKANADRGDATAAGDVATSMSTGESGQARRLAGQQAAQQFLQSGATPADVEYKREQQTLSNLGSFVAGQTPQSQFRNISGAANGAAPFVPGQQAPSMPGNASAAGPAYTIGAWQQQLRANQGQANGWLAGLSGLLSATGSLAKSLPGVGTNPNG